MHTERVPVMNSVNVEIGNLADGKVSDRIKKPQERSMGRLYFPKIAGTTPVLNAFRGPCHSPGKRGNFIAGALELRRRWGWS